MKKTAVFILLLSLAGCGSNVARTERQNSRENAGQTKSNINQQVDEGKDVAGQSGVKNPPANQPRTVREFFALLPEKYFTLEGCDRGIDKNCDKARAEYLKNFLEVEDTQNGYLKAGCDGAQSCLTMALFKRPDNTYLVGVNTEFEMGDDYYFLDYADGKWIDVSIEVVPEFSRKNMYQLPRYGTTVKVFAKKIIEEGKDFTASEKGAWLYDLEWKDGKFTRK